LATPLGQLMRAHLTDRGDRTSRPARSSTPTGNATLAFKRGGFASLCDALDYAAIGETGVNFFDSRGQNLSSLTYRDLRAEAQAFARRLIGAGIARGERLVLIAHTWPAFCVAFFGAQYAGVVPVPVATPVGLGSGASYIEQLRGQIMAAGAVAVLAPDDLNELAQAAVKGTIAWLVGPMSIFDSLVQDDGPLRPFRNGEAFRSATARRAMSRSRLAARDGRAASTFARTSSWRTSQVAWRLRT
jgi:fatty-acyl-CoA synthase